MVHRWAHAVPGLWSEAVWDALPSAARCRRREGGRDLVVGLCLPTLLNGLVWTASAGDQASSPTFSSRKSPRDGPHMSSHRQPTGDADSSG